jgi:hypothetical protein
MRTVFASLVAGLVLLLGSGSAHAIRSLHWDDPFCEPPSVFYSSRHQSGARPCCATQVGVCPGGSACPASGVCAGGVRCTPGPRPSRPNVMLFITDDQSACHYGHAAECRSARTGTAIPSPATPNIDLLAGQGTVFPVAHNTAAWCFPSIASIITSRYQKNIGAGRRVGETYLTIPRVLRALTGSGAPADPFDPDNAIGGYCTMQSGKGATRVGKPGFDVTLRLSERRLGKLPCQAGGAGQPPECGTERQASYQPHGERHIAPIFEFIDAMMYPLPGGTGAYGVQPFFAWILPRLPHQPLRAPAVVENYLFGSDGLHGLFDLGALCAGTSCGPTRDAFDESVFGTVRQFYASVWWADDYVRELRKYLARASEPHCVDTRGQSRFGLTPANCPGTWVSSVEPGLDANTVIMHLADNGWHTPLSKHHFTENGYRTRLVVFDPRALPSVPDYRDARTGAPPPRESRALAHTNDILPTVLGLATGAAAPVACPQSDDGTRCDGRDLRPHLATAPGGPAAPETLRHAMCGHFTQRSTTASRFRYLITRAGAVGRCTRGAAAACTSDAACGPGGFCLGGRCAPRAEPTCSTTAQCPAGGLCLGGRCRSGPSCIEDADCTRMFGAGSICVERETRWCRNAPHVRCTVHGDCPACPQGSAACGRLCEARQLKAYVTPSGDRSQLADLFLDPDESGLHGRSTGAMVPDLSAVNGPYAGTIGRMACCIDAWWPEGASGGSACKGTCPASLSCVD